jgi:hypothetical protein
VIGVDAIDRLAATLAQRLGEPTREEAEQLVEREACLLDDVTRIDLVERILAKSPNQFSVIVYAIDRSGTYAVTNEAWRKLVSAEELDAYIKARLAQDYAVSYEAVTS